MGSHFCIPVERTDLLGDEGGVEERRALSAAAGADVSIQITHTAGHVVYITMETR